MFPSPSPIALLTLAIVCHADETTKPGKYLAETCTTNADCGDHRCRTSMGTTRGIVQSKSGLYKFEVTNPDTGKTCSITKDARDARAENGELPGCCFAREGVFKYTPKEIAGFAIGGLALVFICMILYEKVVNKKTFSDSCNSAFSCVCTAVCVFCTFLLCCGDSSTGGSGGGCDGGSSTTKDTDPPTNPTDVPRPLDRV